MAVTYSIVSGDPDGLFEIVGGKVVAALDLVGKQGDYTLVLRAEQETTVTFTIAEAVIPAGRIMEITTTYGGRPNIVPQSTYDVAATEGVDTNLHPPMGPFTHTAVKSGNWSDLTLWDTGSIPGTGAVVNLGSFTVTYDVESDVILKDIHSGGAGILKFATHKDTRMRVDTIMNHGPVTLGERNDLMPESATPGKPRCEIIFHIQQAPLASARGGWLTMSSVRALGAKKSDRLFSSADMNVGDAQIALEGLPASNWRVGDTLVVVGTEYVPLATTDPQYTGPTTCWSPYFGTFGTETSNAFQNNQDEERTITSINATHVTLNSPLSYKHHGAARTLSHGQVVNIKPVVINLSRSIRLRTADSSDLALDPTADLTNLQKRAHTMFMHSTDIDVRYVEFKNMARTDTNPTLFVAGLPYVVEMAGGYPSYGPILSANGGTPLANPNNVRGRYAVHLHNGGNALGGGMAVLKGLSVYAPIGEVPCPGWLLTQHGTRASIENCVVSNGRGAGIVTELGSETGQWIDNTVTGMRGDGYRTGWGDRAEIHDNHNGHMGVAFESQSRHILQQGNIAAGSRFGWKFHQQKHDVAKRTPRDIDLRLWDPLTQGVDGLYGIRQAQIPDFIDNHCYAVTNGFFVAHRGPDDRFDRTPMLGRGFHCLNVPKPYQVQNYSNSYHFHDSLWIAPLAQKSSSTAVALGVVAWRFIFVNIHLANFQTCFFDEGVKINYEGEIIDCTFENCTTISGTGYHTFGSAAATQPSRDIMGPWTLHPTDPLQAVVRTYRSLDSATELPTPYPLAPYGKKLPEGHPPVNPGDPAYFVLGSGDGDLSGVDTTVSAGNVKGQVAIHGIIRDAVGDCRFPDFQTPESYPNGLTIKGARLSLNMTGEDIVERNGCFNDGGVWKSRIWFTDLDRFSGEYFQFSVDLTLSGFAEDFLTLNTVDPDVAPTVPLLPEAVDPVLKPLIPDTSPPEIVIASTYSFVEGTAFSVYLRSRKLHTKWAISGPDAAHFEIFNSFYLRFVGGGTKNYEAPDDADLDRVYNVTIRATSPAGYFTDLPISVTLRDFPENLTSFIDNFDTGSGPLDDRYGYRLSSGPAGGLTVSNGSIVQDGESLSTYEMLDVGTPNHSVQATLSQGGPVFRARVVDDLNYWYLARESNNANVQVGKVVNGVSSIIATYGSFSTAKLSFFDDTFTVHNGSTLQSPASGSTVGITGPAGNKVGLKTTVNAGRTLDSIVVGLAVLTLNTLSVSNKDYRADWAPGTVISPIQNRATGTVITVSDPRFAITDVGGVANLVVGSTPSAGGDTFSIDLTETREGAVGSPKTTTITGFTVRAYVEPTATASSFNARATSAGYGADATREGYITALIDGLIADGVWRELDVLAVPASHNVNHGYLNWIGDGSTDFVATGTPTYTLNKGILMPNTSTWIESPFNPSVGTPKYSRVSGHVLTYDGATPPANSTRIRLAPAATGAAITTTLGANASQQTAYRFNEAAQNSIRQSYTNVSGGKFAYAVNKVHTATTLQEWRNGIKNSGSVAGGVTGLPNGPTRLVNPVATLALSVGGGLTDAQMVALTNRLKTYLTSIGALP